MKILSLEIKNIRGIKYISLNPQGKNLVIWGMNGSGKSAVLDAIDFLLTGGMHRLTGDGTGDITLKQHGAHIDCTNPSEACVTARVQIPSIKSIVTITRHLGDANNLVCDDEAAKDALDRTVSMAQHGHHVLTRREILQFVAAKGKDRGQRILELLDITEVDSIRSALVKAATSTKANHSAATAALEQAKRVVEATALIENFSETNVLAVINENRLPIGGESIVSFRATDLCDETHPPAFTNQGKASSVSAEPLINRLREHLELLASVQGETSGVVDLIQKIHSQPEAVKVYRRKQLIDLGLELIDESGSCPLCDIQWNVSELESHLLSKREIANLATAQIVQVQQKVSTVITVAQTIIGDLRALIRICGDFALGDQLNLFSEHASQLESAVELADAIRNDFSLDTATKLKSKLQFDPSFINESAKTVLDIVSACIPIVTPEQRAWELLIRLEENLKGYTRAKDSLEVAKRTKESALRVLKIFEMARDNILGRLYDEVRSRFVSLYRQLHGEDEKSFQASFEPTSAGLKFAVDFYNRGQHPPHALHSEGHQDSMGLCLFLALADQLAKDILDLIVLDDVVMSVDIEHRRELCKVLVKNFPQRQFIITTHDKTWAQMLRAQRVVDKAGLKEFFNWTVETGPNVIESRDVWDTIEKDLVNNDVSGAAAKLRKTAEQYFYGACEDLRAQIAFSSNGQWDLGELGSSAIGALKKRLLKQRRPRVLGMIITAK